MLTVRAKPRKTVEDFMALPDGVRAELIQGELFVSPSPRLRHQEIAGRIFRRLADFVERGELGFVYDAPIDVHLPSGDVVQPDIVFVAAANRGVLQDWIRGVPDLVIEVSPEGIERDRIVKFDLYARNGVREYWIVDDAHRAVEVFVLRGDRFSPEGSFTKSQTVGSALLAGFSISIADIFA